MLRRATDRGAAGRRPARLTWTTAALATGTVEQQNVLPPWRATRKAMETDCPCGSGATYVACRGAFHSASATAATAEQSMRSRYSAFAVGDADYLLATWHPATPPASVNLDPAIEWRRLRIRAVPVGTDADDAGAVSFVAHYWDSAHQQYGREHENSRFTRQARSWFYVGPA